MKHGEGVQYGSLGYTYATAEGAGGGGGVFGYIKDKGKEVQEKRKVQLIVGKRHKRKRDSTNGQGSRDE